MVEQAKKHGGFRPSDDTEDMPEDPVESKVAEDRLLKDISSRYMGFPVQSFK